MPSTTTRPALARLTAAALFAFSFPLAALAAADMKPLNKVEPEFPREARQAGTAEGKVRARMTLDGSGEVTRVEIVEAIPRRVFDRAVVRALSQWKYPSGSAGRTVDVDFEFRTR
jgi:protein TonB